MVLSLLFFCLVENFFRKKEGKMTFITIFNIRRGRMIAELRLLQDIWTIWQLKMSKLAKYVWIVIPFNDDLIYILIICLYIFIASASKKRSKRFFVEIEKSFENEVCLLNFQHFICLFFTCIRTSFHYRIRRACTKIRRHLSESHT